MKAFWLGVAIFIGGLIVWLINHAVNGTYFNYGGNVYFGCMIFGILVIIGDYLLNKN